MSYDLNINWKTKQDTVATRDIIDFFAKCGLDISVYLDEASEIKLMELGGWFPIVINRNSKLLDGKFKADLNTGFELYSYEYDDPDEPEYGTFGASISLPYSVTSFEDFSYGIDNCLEFVSGFIFAGALANVLDGEITDPQTSNVRIIPQQYEQFKQENLTTFLDITISHFKSELKALSRKEIKRLEGLGRE